MLLGWLGIGPKDDHDEDEDIKSQKKLSERAAAKEVIL